MKDKIGLLLLLCFLIAGCKKQPSLKPDEDYNEIYVLKTIEPYDKLCTHAYIGGVFFSDHASDFHTYGLCWDVKSLPTIDGGRVEISDVTPYHSYTYTYLIQNLTPNKKYYIRAFAVSDELIIYGNQITLTADNVSVQCLLDEGRTLNEVLSMGYPADSLIGKIYKNGFIFKLKTDSFPGMVASTCTDVYKIWGVNANISGTLSGLGKGSNNTNKIISGDATQNIAARNCRTSAADTGWFLPSSVELNYMYSELKLKGYGNLSDSVFWSSTQNDYSKAYCIDFSTGLQTSLPKSSFCAVRCVKYF